MPQDGRADLHLHTTASDGTCSVHERAEQASDVGLEAIAITDHDTISNQLSERTTTMAGVKVVTGVEVRADMCDTKIEILGYFVDPSDEELQSVLERVREFRHGRNRELVAALNDTAGLGWDYEELAAATDSLVGRPYFAEELVDAGIVGDIQSAFDEYLAAEAECFVEMERLGYQRVIDAIHHAGGVASLAHPGRVRADVQTVEAMVETLVDSGLDAIEVPYPYGTVRSSDYAAVGVEDASAWAEACGLLVSGGSDCHGPGSGKYRIGDRTIDEPALEALRSEAAQYQ